MTSGDSASAEIDVTRLTPGLLADRSAAAASAGPAFGPGQWVYRKTAAVATPEDAANPRVAERWSTADGTTTASYIGGQLYTGPSEWSEGPGGEVVRSDLDLPALSYAALSTLPADPAAIVGLLAETPSARDEAWHPGHAFEMIAGLFMSYTMPPVVAAQIYSALGQIPGTAAIAWAIGVTGQRGPGFVLIGKPGGNQQITVSPRDYQFTGYQFFGRGLDLGDGSAWGATIAEQALVAGPGIRP